MEKLNIYVKPSGSIAKMVKDFAVYKGQYNTFDIDIYVDKKIFVDKQSKYVAKIAEIIQTTDGKEYTTQSFEANYIKDSEDVLYSIYSLACPKIFTDYSGQQKLVINIVQLNEKVEKVIATQISYLNIQDSAYICNDEIVEPSEVEKLSGKINENTKKINSLSDELTKKQNIEDKTLQTIAKQIVPSINEVNSIAINTQSSADRAKERADEAYSLAESCIVQINPIGTLVTATLDNINTQLNKYVQEQEKREPLKGDFVTVVVGEKAYNYTYTMNGWYGYKIPSIAIAENDNLGIVEGTYNTDNIADKIKPILVDIKNGKIENLYVLVTYPLEPDRNNYFTLSDYLSSITLNVHAIQGEVDALVVEGTFTVKLADKAIKDGNGNIIVDTYLKKEDGLTQEDLKDYQKRIYGKTYYYNANELSTDVSVINEPIVTKVINEQNEVILTNDTILEDDIVLTNQSTFFSNLYCEFQMSDNQVIGNFTLSIQTKKQTESDYKDLTTISNLGDIIIPTTGGVNNIHFDTNFVDLIEETKLNKGDNLRIVIKANCSSPIHINVYSNDQNPSTFRFTSVHTTSSNSIWTYDSFNNFPKIGIKDRIYIAKDTNLQYRWKSEENKYVQLGFIVDLNNYYTKEEVNNELSKKPDDEKISSLANKLRFNQLFDIKTSTLPSKNGLIVTNIYGGHHIAGITDSQYYHKMYDIDTIIGHLYYFAPNFSDKKGVYILGHIDSTKFSTKDGKIFEGGNKFDIYIQIEKNNTIDLNVKPILIDLTEMFGTGNEPTIDNIYTYIDNNVYYPYFVNACEDMIFSTERKDNANQLANINVDGTNWGFDYKQDKADNALETTNKTVVGAVNELQENKANLTDFKYNFEQLVNPQDYRETYLQDNTTFTNKGDYFEVDTQGDGSTFPYPTFNKKPIDLKYKHKYYVNYIVKGNISDNIDLRILVQTPGNDDYNVYGVNGVIVTGGKTAELANFYMLIHKKTQPCKFSVYPICIDLTQMFGAGNEPSTVEEVQKYLIPNKYYPYGRNVEPSIYATVEDFRYNFRQLFDYKNAEIVYGIETTGIVGTNNNDGSFTFKGKGTATGLLYQINYPIKLIQGHKYLYNANCTDPTIVNVSYRVSDSNGTYMYSGRIFNSQINDTAIRINLRVDLDEIYDYTITPQVIDLTDMFGVGKEPTTVAEVQQYLVAGKYYPYGRNIEPRMYCTKAEANSLSMCPSDIVDVSIIPDDWGGKNRYIFTPKTNGYLMLYTLLLNVDGGELNLTVEKKGTIIGFSTMGPGARYGSVIVPLSKNVTYSITVPLKSKVQIRGSSFIHSKEIEL